MTGVQDQNWPNDADGDVLRSLRAQSFDFTVPHRVEFEVDFATEFNFPTIQQQIREISTNVREYKRSVSGLPYLIVEIEALLTYEFVVATQNRLSELTKAAGGHCEAWGILH